MRTDTDFYSVNTNEIATLGECPEPNLGGLSGLTIVAEFTLTGHGNQDNYDISNVDGKSPTPSSQSELTEFRLQPPNVNHPIRREL